jgi:hypothetical protein
MGKAGMKMKLIKRQTPPPNIAEAYQDPPGEREFLISQGAQLKMPRPKVRTPEAVIA